MSSDDDIYPVLPKNTKRKFMLILDKEAKKSGGDKYTYEDDGKTKAIYVPQDVSRKEGSPKPTLKLKVSDEKEGWKTLLLTKKAKGSGDNRFEDSTSGFTVYLPLPGEKYSYRFS